MTDDLATLLRRLADGGGSLLDALRAFGLLAETIGPALVLDRPSTIPERLQATSPRANLDVGAWGRLLRAAAEASRSLRPTQQQWPTEAILARILNDRQRLLVDCAKQEKRLYEAIQALQPEKVAEWSVCRRIPDWFRALLSRTNRILDDSGAPFTIVVEPWRHNRYSRRIGLAEIKESTDEDDL